MNVHQVFLQLVRLGEELHAASAAVLRGQTQVVQRQVGLQLLLAAQLLAAFFTGKLGQGSIQVELHVGLEVGQLMEGSVALITGDTLYRSGSPSRTGGGDGGHGVGAG